MVIGKEVDGDEERRRRGEERKGGKNGWFAGIRQMKLKVKPCSQPFLRMDVYKKMCNYFLVSVIVSIIPIDVIIVWLGWPLLPSQLCLNPPPVNGTHSYPLTLVYCPEWQPRSSC